MAKKTRSTARNAPQPANKKKKVKTVPVVVPFEDRIKHLFGNRTDYTKVAAFFEFAYGRKPTFEETKALINYLLTKLNYQALPTVLEACRLRPIARNLQLTNERRSPSTGDETRNLD